MTSLTTTGDFKETDDCAGTQVAPVAACSVQVVFLATAVGSRAGVLTVYGNVSGGQATAARTGTGLAPAAVVLDPLSLNFGSVTVAAGFVCGEYPVSLAPGGDTDHSHQKTPFIQAVSWLNTSKNAS